MHTLDQVAQSNAWRTRPLAEKLILSCGLLMVDLTQPPVTTAPLIVLVLSILALGFAHIPPKVWGWGLAAPFGFAATGTIPMLFPLDLAHLMAGLEVILRALAGGACLIFLGLTTPIPRLIQAARRVGLSPELAEVALLTYRFIFLLADEAAAMHHAQTARMGRATAMKRLRSVGLIIARLLPRALHRAKRLELGLAARNWQGAFPTLSPAPAMTPSGMALSVGVVLAVLGWGMIR